MGTGLTATRLRLHYSVGRALGRGHERDGTPCQDFVEARSENGLACVALADGAGSRSHSEFGAKAAVTTVMRLVMRDFAKLYDMAETDTIVTAKHIHNEVIDKLEAVAKRHKVPVDTLACTLMFVGLRDGQYLAGHIGDGVIGRKNGEGSSLLSAPDNGEYSNCTYFVTDEDAAARFRIYFGRTGQAGSDAFMVMSDGAAESLFSRKTQRLSKAAEQLLDWSMTMSRKQMDQVLRANLMQSIRMKTADDCSIGIVGMSQESGESTE